MNPYLMSWIQDTDRPRMIVTGNEKGGSGKSTLAIHLITGLLHRGFRVGSIDLDGRQATLSRFMENRREQARSSPRLRLSEHRRLALSRNAFESKASDEKLDHLCTALDSLMDCDVVVADSPGSDSVLCRAGHVLADVLVTPLNASFLDLDALVEVNADATRIVGPSPYSELVLYMCEQRTALGAAPIDWIVLCNRLPNVETRVHRSVTGVLHDLAPRLGFRVFPGIHERVVFRERFLQGLTVFDVARKGRWLGANKALTIARKEVDELLEMIVSEGLSAQAGRHGPSRKGAAVETAGAGKTQ